MSNRLREWVEANEVLRDSQAGFRRERGMRDHIFALNYLSSNRLKLKGGKLNAFIHYKTAFDAVDRTLFFNKLKEKGIYGIEC